MKNPWEKISLSDYESHMGLNSIQQLQALNKMMKQQFDDFPVETAMLLGIAGGNGLEHIDLEKYKTIYGIDVNAEYLKIASERYFENQGVLKCIHMDLIEEAEKLPQAQLVIANLLIEYIGYDVFRRVILQVQPVFVSCVIQINTCAKQWVSDSPYLRAFDCLEEIHHQISDTELIKIMDSNGYDKINLKSYSLPNSKSLVKIDFRKKVENN